MNFVLPLIVDTLRNKPLNEETEKTLIKDVKRRFRNQDLKCINFKRKFDRALEIGEDLGIFQIVDENQTNQPESEINRRNTQRKAISKNKTETNTYRERRLSHFDSTVRGNSSSRGHSRSRSRRRASGRLQHKRWSSSR